jgi:hypothetical protein
MYITNKTDHVTGKTRPALRKNQATLTISRANFSFVQIHMVFLPEKFIQELPGLRVREQTSIIAIKEKGKALS